MNPTDTPLDWLIAHRGWPEKYPENSLEGVQAVLEAGALHVEFDVQLTQDLQPVVIHDEDLDRLTGQSKRITDLRLNQLGELRTGPEGSRSSHIATLAEMLALFDAHPETTAYVELKRDSIRRFGRKVAVEAVMRHIRQAGCRCVFLSFEAGAVALARKSGATEIGWAFRPWSLLSRATAWWLQPDYLFIRSDRVPERERPFWPGHWQWVVYRIDDLATARGFRQRGADLIEVDNLPGLLQ